MMLSCHGDKAEWIRLETVSLVPRHATSHTWTFAGGAYKLVANGTQALVTKNLLERWEVAKLDSFEPDALIYLFRHEDVFYQNG